MLAALLFLSLTGQGDPPLLEGPNPTPPRWVSVRAIQYDYNPRESWLALEWEVEGQVTAMSISVDGSLPTSISPDLRQIRLEPLAVGLHTIDLECSGPGGAIATSIEHDILEEPRVEPVWLTGCLFYGFEFPKGGSLIIAWDAPERPAEDPYLEYEIHLDDKLSARTPEPRRSLTLRDVREGLRSVRITGITRSYASPPADFRCRATAVPSPQRVTLVPGCQNRSGWLSITYGVAPGTRYETVGVWVTRADGIPDFKGFFQPEPRQITLSELSDGPIEVELALGRLEEGEDAPHALSNLPRAPGFHATARGMISCTPANFRRGDASGDGRVNITDAGNILRWLFLTDAAIGCLEAADIDDSGAVDLTDPIRLLGYLFAGGLAPVSPGPRVCGSDPTAGLQCTASGCPL